MAMITDKYYIIETRSSLYPSNIYRQLIAHVTGHIGHNDDTSASRYVDEEIKVCFEDALLPVIMQKTGWAAPGDHDNNFINIRFKSRPTQKQMEIIKARLKTFPQAFMAKDKLADYIGYITDIEFGEPRIFLFITEKTEISYEG